MRLRFSPLAEHDLESIGDYIAADSPVRAVSFVLELREQCQRIARNPWGYRARPELGEGLRSCAWGNYVIFFEAETDEVAIVRILHGARDLPAALGIVTH
ncbi:MAG: type II toxin-antitoxin system RelE/ParE family toxin [Burkholderiaceae bacterium]|jgi:toxin ParE1/3/4|nr:type II toxin-antitoxin system RelE/ParE family toxin [Burkholderiaceae bacterium]